MPVSLFELFSIGIGPSSSHTVGPMRAAARFARRVVGGTECDVDAVRSARVILYGSLAATGRGHGTDGAVIAGLCGLDPQTCDLDALAEQVDTVRKTRRLRLCDGPEIDFDPDTQIEFRRKVLPFHSNGMRFRALDAGGQSLLRATYYSTGGGFLTEGAALAGDSADVKQPAAESSLAKPSAAASEERPPQPYPFGTAADLLALCERTGLSISDVMLANESAWRPETDVREGIQTLWRAMKACVSRGCHTGGVLPGGLKVRRRAAQMYETLAAEVSGGATPDAMDWLSVWALAVNEENAAGGRVVTAPTNGAAGIIPSVLHYAHAFGRDGAAKGAAWFDDAAEDAAAGAAARPAENDDLTLRFFLAAAAVGRLFKENASISGAEVGCQGEVGSASAMAAAGLCEAFGGTPRQVENAAEIAMEHNLGLTCDPIGGLVQVPCIERNAVAAVKSVSAVRLALRGDGLHRVSLDKVIKTMRDTGADMKAKYKETSRGGLAVNVIEC